MAGRPWLASLLTLAAAAQGLGPLPVNKPDKQPRPAWIETLPEAPDKLYAVGTADLAGNEGEAIRQASDRARLEVVARLRATVRGGTSVTTRTTEVQVAGGKLQGAGDRQVREEVRIEARAEDLPGMAVERTYADPAVRTAYALASLDLGQTRRALAARLDWIREGRAKVGEEWNRKNRWRLRRLKDELTRLEGAVTLLAPTGSGRDLALALQEERAAIEKRLDAYEGRELPPLDWKRTAVTLRSNVELPAGIVAYLEARLGANGLVCRDLDPDLTLDLRFSGGAKGPEFIYAVMDVASGVDYRMDARMTFLDPEGTPLTRPALLQVFQPDSPEGMVERFGRQFERRLPKLIHEVQAQFQ